MKKILMSTVLLFATSSFADLSNLVWIPRSQDLPQLSQPEAQNYCDSISARLPTPQEFRDLALALQNSSPGAVDLPDGNYWSSEVHPHGWGVEFLCPDHTLGVTSEGNRNLVVCVVDL